MINISPVLVVVVMVVMTVTVAAHIPPVPSVCSFRAEINKTGYVNISINVTLTSVRVTTVAVDKQ
jgi:hypothetical protein